MWSYTLESFSVVVLNVPVKKNFALVPNFAELNDLMRSASCLEFAFEWALHTHIREFRAYTGIYFVQICANLCNNFYTDVQIDIIWDST